MEKIKEYLPEGWEEMAKETGALRRGREIKTAEELLLLIMLYITNEGSYQLAATGLYATRGIHISKVAAYKRMKGSGEWLRQMVRKMCAGPGIKGKKPEFLGEKRVKLVDASNETTKGKGKSVWRLHYEFDPFAFECMSVELTGEEEGERLTRHEVREGDILIADRVYCTITGIEHVISGGGDYVLRMKWKAFHLYDEKGKRIELLPEVRRLKAHESMDIRCYYKLSTGQMRPIRIVVMKKDEKGIEESKRKMARKASRRQEKAASAETAEANEYILLATSVEYTKEQVLELYRARWQIEQVFYRLKSLFGYGEVPSKNPEAVKAWFYGKLFLAALCEKILKTENFSPGPAALVGTWRLE